MGSIEQTSYFGHMEIPAGIGHTDLSGIGHMDHYGISHTDLMGDYPIGPGRLFGEPLMPPRI